MPKHPNRERVCRVCVLRSKTHEAKITNSQKNPNLTPTNLNFPANHNHHQALSKPRKLINPPSSLSLSISSIYGLISLFFFFPSLTARFELLTGRSALSSRRSMPPFFSVIVDMWVCRWVMIFFFLF
jgi:hypothetical protein